MSQPPQTLHQSYRRHTADVWDYYKTFIRKYFIDQDKTYKDVVALHEKHGFDIRYEPI